MALQPLAEREVLQDIRLMAQTQYSIGSRRGFNGYFHRGL